MKFNIQKGLCCLILSLSLLSNISMVYAGGVHTAHIDYISQYSAYTGMEEDAELIVLGTVSKVEASRISTVIYTHYQIDVQEVLKNSGNHSTEDVCMRFTGGTLEDETLLVEETPTLEVGKTYLFAAKKTYPDQEEDNDYTPCGAYQGVFETTIPETKTVDAEPEYDYSKYKITSLNAKNSVEKKIKGITLDQFMKKGE